LEGNDHGLRWYLGNFPEGLRKSGEELSVQPMCQQRVELDTSLIVRSATGALTNFLGGTKKKKKL
jgi:hypothetical protein